MPPYMIDASVPPVSAIVPPDLGGAYAAAIGGYLGGYTPHPWTLAEWAEFKTMPRLPIWVYNPGLAGVEGGVTDGFAALVALHRTGAPPCPVAIDMETHVDADYVDTFTTILNLSDYWAVVYGSAGTVFGNPRRGGYWVADWPASGQTGQPHMYAAAGVVGTQFRSLAAIDISVITPTFLSQLWC